MQRNEVADGHAARSVLVALRRIMQAVDSHSRRLVQRTGLSVPQILILQALDGPGEPPGTSDLAARLSLTQGTVSSILERLENKGLICRTRGGGDRRRVQISLTDAGRDTLSNAPATLHDDFLRRFGELADWEQSLILASLQRVADLMRADALNVAPVLEPAAELGVGDADAASGCGR